MWPDFERPSEEVPPRIGVLFISDAGSVIDLANRLQDLKEEQNGSFSAPGKQRRPEGGYRDAQKNSLPLKKFNIEK